FFVAANRAGLVAKEGRQVDKSPVLRIHYPKSSLFDRLIQGHLGEAKHGQRAHARPISHGKFVARVGEPLDPGERIRRQEIQCAEQIMYLWKKFIEPLLVFHLRAGRTVPTEPVPDGNTGLDDIEAAPVTLASTQITISKLHDQVRGTLSDPDGCAEV